MNSKQANISFFSKEALQMIGKKYNYKVIFLQSGFILMTYNNFQCNKIKLFFLKNFLIREKIFQLLRIIKIFLKQKVMKMIINILENK